MRVVLQRVLEASVSVEHEVVGMIGSGLLVLLGISHGDDQPDADYLVQKISQMRLFGDEAGKMNLSVHDENGDIMVISQFTLYAKTKKGNRPSFIEAARPDKAIPLYKYFVEKMEETIKKKVQTGIFGADMKVKLINDGPVTIFLDSHNKDL